LRHPDRCPYCKGANNHSPGFDCRAQQNRQTLVDRILELERKVAKLEADAQLDKGKP
jgi:hypothetical protein